MAQLTSTSLHLADIPHFPKHTNIKHAPQYSLLIPGSPFATFSVTPASRQITGDILEMPAAYNFPLQSHPKMANIAKSRVWDEEKSLSYSARLERPPYHPIAPNLRS